MALRLAELLKAQVYSKLCEYLKEAIRSVQIAEVGWSVRHLQEGLALFRRIICYCLSLVLPSSNS